MLLKKIFILMMLTSTVATTFAASDDVYEQHRLAGLKLQTILAHIQTADKLPAAAKESAYRTYFNMLLNICFDPTFVGNREIAQEACIRLGEKIGISKDLYFRYPMQDLVNEARILDEVVCLLEQIYELVKSPDLYQEPQLAQQLFALYSNIEKTIKKPLNGFLLPNEHPVTQKFSLIERSLDSADHIKDIVEGLLSYKKSFYTTHKNALNELCKAQDTVAILRGIIKKEGRVNERLIKYLAATNTKISNVYQAIQKNREETERHSQGILSMLDRDAATKEVLKQGMAALFAQLNREALELELNGKALVADWAKLHQELGIVRIVQSVSQ